MPRDIHSSVRTVMTLRGYLAGTRDPRFNILMVVGLLSVYEAGMLLTGSPYRNAADLYLRRALALLGPHAVQGFHVFLLALLVIAAGSLLCRKVPAARYVPFFLMEAGAYAVLLSPAVFFIESPLLEVGGVGDLLLDLGAGVYEELVFRFLLIRALIFILRADPWHVFFSENDRAPAAFWKIAGPLTVVVLASSTAFALYHHWGSEAEPLTTGLFLFRFVAGLLLALVYFFRGLGMAVYTHAFYDVLVHLT